MSNGCGNCCVTTLRVILYINCILSVPMNIWDICRSIAGHWTLDLELHYGFGTIAKVVFILISLGINLFGIYALYTNNSKLLVWYAVCLAVISGISIISTVAIGSMGKTIDQAMGRLSDMQKNYQWQLKPGEKPNNASRIWNSVQSDLMCCGVTSGDWSKFKPNDYPYNVPKSCCKQYIGLDVYRNGTNLGCTPFGDSCSLNLKTIRTSALVASISSIGIQLLLALSAFIVSKYGASDPTSTENKPQVSAP